MSETRFEKLEAHVADLQNEVEVLSQIVARQDSDIEKLKRTVEILVQREAAREAEGGGGVILGDERPPHY